MKATLKTLIVSGLVGMGVALSGSNAHGAAADVVATWTGLFNDTNQNWTDGNNWSSTPDYPSAVGAGAIFVLDGNTPDHLRVNVTPLTGEPAVTVGSIVFNNTSSKQVTLTGGTSTPMRFDADGDGPVTVTVQGDATGTAAPNQMNARAIFDDSVVAIVNPTSNTSVSGDLDWTGLVPSGAGGFTKQGLGILTLGSNAKSYTGPTVFDTESGRTRISVAGRPNATSSVTFKSGSQMTLITANSTYTFGANDTVPLNLNGAGPTSGVEAAFPGVIRNNTDIATTITNDVVLQSDSLIHVQGATTGSTTLAGDVSGVGRLLIGSLPHDANLGKVQLSGSNSYSGGTTVQAGTLVATGSSVNAFGVGGVIVNAAGPTGGGVSKITIDAGASNVIADNAMLTLSGGGAGGLADDGFAELAAGIDELIGSLTLGVTLFTAPGTYGSTSSGADFQFDEYFSGDGLLRIDTVSVLAGDYNEDGKVDAADYVLWRKTPADHGNAGGYATWKQHFGESNAGSGSGGAVPEPASLLLVAIALPCLGLRRRAN